MLTLREDDLPLESLYRWERERADRIYLTQPFDGGKIRDWTWAEAAGEVRRVAAYLCAQDWEPGSRVAILSKNCAWWVMADLAVWMAGHVTVPIYPSLKAQSVRQILEHSEARACFIGAADEKDLARCGVPTGVECICFPNAAGIDAPKWDALLTKNPPIAGSPTRPADDLATIIYTSGTTGLPKGVMHRFSALSFVARALIQLLQLTADERILSYLPLAHIVERMGIEMSTLVLGGRMFFTEGVETFLTDLRRAKPTIFLSVPRLLLKLQQGVFAKVPKNRLDRLLRIPIVSAFLKRRILGQLGLDTVRFAASGAAPLPPETLMWYRKLGLPLVEGYGMTEILITHVPNADGVRPGFVGGALSGVENKLGENDELLVRSPMNMVGYYKDPEGTCGAFTQDGFFRTGDIARIEPDGQLKIIGRLKEQFKTSKGKYVAPAPIESKLAAHPDVEACCLMGAGLPGPFALVLLSPEARARCADFQAKQALEESLQAQMTDVNVHLDPHERVSFVVIADGPWTIGNGMITPTLKVKRHAVEDRYQKFIEDWGRRHKPVVWESVP
jgi:long-chain acyl-CoA synthetase